MSYNAPAPKPVTDEPGLTVLGGGGLKKVNMLREREGWGMRECV